MNFTFVYRLEPWCWCFWVLRSLGRASLCPSGGNHGPGSRGRVLAWWHHSRWRSVMCCWQLSIVWMETDKINRTRISCSVGAPAAGSSSPTVAVVRLCVVLCYHRWRQQLSCPNKHTWMSNIITIIKTPFVIFLIGGRNLEPSLLLLLILLLTTFYSVLLILKTNLNKRRRHLCTVHFSSVSWSGILQ